MNDQRKRDKLAAITQQRHGIYTSADLWALEALKHVAIVGSAGTAAVFALIAGNGLEKADGLSPALCFAFGTILATISMAVGYYQRETALGIHLEAERILEENSDDFAHYYRLQDIVAALAPLIGFLGWSGLLLDCIGGVLLFRAFQ